MDRFELKYLLHERCREPFLNFLRNNCVLDDNSREGPYRVNSLYYDNSKRELYYQNIDGVPFRRKLRIRHYGDFQSSGPRYAEIKQRKSQRILKKRIQIPSQHEKEFLDPHFTFPLPEKIWRDEMLFLVDSFKLKPKVYTSYLRMGFFDPSEERLRITLDIDLSGIKWRKDITRFEDRASLLSSELSIVELKGKHRLPFWLIDAIRDFELKRVKMSKYCEAVRKFK